MVFGTIIRAIIQHFSTQNIQLEENAKVDWFAEPANQILMDLSVSHDNSHQMSPIRNSEKYPIAKPAQTKSIKTCD
jgi:hypothetical protein